MGQYGKAAIRAWKLFTEGSAETPRKAWEQAITEFTDSQSSQEKECPRFVFLALCEEGCLKGIEEGDYVGWERRNRLYAPNKQCALQAVEELRKDSSLADSKKRLWAIVGKGQSDTNGQMDVVLALWVDCLLCKK